MHFFSLIMLAISSNLDNLGVGISYGLRKIRLPFKANLIVAGITSSGTLLSMACGKWIAFYFPVQAANLLGSLTIAAAGLWIIILDRKKTADGEWFLENWASATTLRKIRVLLRARTLAVLLKDPHLADLDRSGHISSPEAVLLGLALTVSNVSVGLGAGLSGLNLFLATFLVGIFSLLALWSGVSFGNRHTSRLFRDKAKFASGLLLIGIGLYEYFVP